MWLLPGPTTCKDSTRECKLTLPMHLRGLKEKLMETMHAGEELTESSFISFYVLSEISLKFAHGYWDCFIPRGRKKVMLGLAQGLLRLLRTIPPRK